MPYDEARFIDSSKSKEILTLVATSTFTASNHVLTSTPICLQAMVESAVLTGAAAVVQTAGVSASPTLFILQGTNIGLSFGTSFTLGAVGVAASLTNTVTFSAGEVPVLKIVHTGTASATQVVPIYNVTLSFRKQYV